MPRLAAPRAEGIHSTVRRDPATSRCPAAHLCGNYVRPSANLWAIGSRRFLWEWDRKDAKFTRPIKKIYRGYYLFNLILMDGKYTLWAVNDSPITCVSSRFTRNYARSHVLCVLSTTAKLCWVKISNQIVESNHSNYIPLPYKIPIPRQKVVSVNKNSERKIFVYYLSTVVA